MAGILVGIIILLVVGLFLLSTGYQESGFLVLVIGVISIVSYFILSFEYEAAEYKAGILNKEYGTSYTQEEVFYASDVIDTIQKLQRKRVEVIVTGEK